MYVAIQSPIVVDFTLLKKIIIIYYSQAILWIFEDKTDPYLHSVQSWSWHGSRLRKRPWKLGMLGWYLVDKTDPYLHSDPELVLVRVPPQEETIIIRQDGPLPP